MGLKKKKEKKEEENTLIYTSASLSIDKKDKFRGIFTQRINKYREPKSQTILALIFWQAPGTNSLSSFHCEILIENHRATARKISSEKEEKNSENRQTRKWIFTSLAAREKRTPFEKTMTHYPFLLAPNFGSQSNKRQPVGGNHLPRNGLGSERKHRYVYFRTYSRERKTGREKRGRRKRVEKKRDKLSLNRSRSAETKETGQKKCSSTNSKHREATRRAWLRMFWKKVDNNNNPREHSSVFLPRLLFLYR